MTSVDPPIPAAIFASGSGSNFQALAEHSAGMGDRALWTPALLVTDRPSAPVLDRARAIGCPTAIIDPRDAEGLLDLLKENGAGMILLAGYLRLIPPEVVSAFSGRILNIHPSLLPAFGGKGMYGSRVHEAVVAAGSEVTGVTVHLVDEEYDRGGILAQHRLRVEPDESADALAARVLEVEHRLYPRVADHLADCLLRGEPPRPMSVPSDNPESIRESP